LKKLRDYYKIMDEIFETIALVPLPFFEDFIKFVFIPLSFMDKNLHIISMMFVTPCIF